MTLMEKRHNKHNHCATVRAITTNLLATVCASEHACVETLTCKYAHRYAVQNEICMPSSANRLHARNVWRNYIHSKTLTINKRQNLVLK